MPQTSCRAASPEDRPGTEGLSPAERQRRYRRRQGRAWVCPVEVSFEIIEQLIDDQLLDPVLSRDRREVAKAIGTLLQKYRYASRPGNAGRG